MIVNKEGLGKGLSRKGLGRESKVILMFHCCVRGIKGHRKGKKQLLCLLLLRHVVELDFRLSISFGFFFLGF